MKKAQEKLYITGGRPISGTLPVQRAKNSALYLLLAAVLTDEPVILEDVPKIADVLVSIEILEHLGVKTKWDDGNLHLHAERLTSTHAPFSLVNRMRASFVAMGALLGRAGEATISMPGGCAFGPRPVDRHIAAFRAIGVDLVEDAGDFIAKRVQPLAGTVHFEAPTVGGTQNIILASALGTGRVVIENAALEPEIPDLANMLNQMGANITGAGTSTITIDGVEQLSGIRFRPVADRIEAGTYLLAAAATRGTLTVTGIEPYLLRSVLETLREAGVHVSETEDSITVDASSSPIRAVDYVATEFPGLPTDLQAPFSAFLATVPGTSRVIDRVYPDRFTHVKELQRAGGTLTLNDRVLTISGEKLTAAPMHAADIRAGGAVVIAGLAASGTSEITGLEYIDRGYDELTERLTALGADVTRVAPAPQTE